jgi:zinc protease
MSPSLVPSWTSGVRREVLSNGLTLLVQRDTSAPVAAIVTHVRAGFFDEPDRWVGISHVLEHMFFKGTPTRGPGQIARETKAAGGYINASTSYDHTSYLAVLPAAQLPAALEIQADALIAAAIDVGELERELKVIIQEAKRKLDHPGAVTQETLHAVMYDRHRIRRWRIGYEQDLARFTRDDVFGYYASRYVPARTIVTFVGDIDVDATLSQASRLYGAWAAAEGARDPSPEEPPRQEVRARTLRGDVTQAVVALGWRGVAALDERAVPLDLAAGILGAGRGSWLQRSLRETGLASTVSAHHYSPTELGIFSIDADCLPVRVEVVVDRIAEATTRLAMAGPAADDLERARTLLLARWSRRMEEADGRAAALASAEALGDYRLLDRDFEQLASTSADAVRSAAASVLDPEAVSAVVYLPAGEGEELTAEALARAFAVTELGGSAARRLGGSAPPPRPGAWTNRSPASRRAAEPPSRRTADIHHLALPGFDLLCRRKPGVPLVSLGVYVPRLRFDPEGRAGVGALTVRSATRGAGQYDAPGLAFAFERLGGTLTPIVTLDWLGFGTVVLSSHLDEAAALLHTVLLAPRFEEEHVDAERGLLVEETARVADDMFRYPFQLGLAEAFGDRAYGIPALGLPNDIARVSLAEIRAWHAANLARTRGVVVAVGDLEPESALERVSRFFAQDPARPAERLDRPVGWAIPGESRSRIVTREKAQSAVAMVFPGPSRREPSRHAAEVWSAVASGLGGRLFEALRDRRSLAYTVLASSWQKARGGALLTYIATSPEREEEARGEMLRELERFAAERVRDAELEQAANYLAGQTQVSRQSGSALAGEILEAWLAGDGLGELADSGERFRAVTAEEVRALAERSFGPAQSRVEGVVRSGTGPAAVTPPQVGADVA